MEHVVLIAAIGENLELGKKNQLIWHLKDYLKFFKEKTMGHDIIMGYQTFCSLPKLLPGRKHIVLTHRNINFLEGVIVCHSLDEVKAYIKSQKKDCYIIGGASVYREMLDDCEKMYLTKIEASDKEADAYFPNFLESEFEMRTLAEHQENNICYKHLEYVRKKR